MAFFYQVLSNNWQFVNFFLQKCLHCKHNFYYVNLILINQLCEVEEPISISHSKSQISYEGIFEEKSCQNVSFKANSN